MCGINGILSFDGKPVSRSVLDGMNSMMLHRGPDDEGCYLDSNVGLAARRLSIIDIAGGHQPIQSEDGRYHVVLNGEIYNYLELRSELLAAGHRFRTKSDTEVIVHLYEDVGERCVDRLNGMFAFAVWDSVRRELFVANDRLGIKPLFYLKTDSFFALSSELKSILTLDFEKEVDKVGILMYLYLLYVPYPRSMVKGVSKLAPASRLKVTEGGDVSIGAYWTAPSVAPEREVAPEGFKARFNELINDSVSLQMRSDVPVGAFLSGGIDSSCIVAALARLNNGTPVSTFSLAYEGHCDEDRRYASLVARRFNTFHKELYLTCSDVRENLRRIVWFMDEPMGDSAAVSNFLLSEAARSSGVKVIYNGSGGDELFGGYPRYLAPGMMARARSKLHSLMSGAPPRPSSRGLVDYCGSINGDPDRLRPLLRDGALFGLLMDGLQETLGAHFDSSAGVPDADRHMDFDIKTYLPGDLLFLLDKMTMGASVEGRVPLLDHRLVEFMAAIPAGLKMDGGELKALVKTALRGSLPDAVLDRKKMGFGGPVLFWLTHDVLDAGLFEDGSFLSSCGLFDAARLRRLVADGKYNRRNCQLLYNLMVLEMWHADVFSAAGGAR